MALYWLHVNKKQFLVPINESLVSQASPYANNAYPATNAFHNKYTHTNRGVGKWWKVNFPVKYTSYSLFGEHIVTSEYSFVKIRIKNRVDCCGQRLALTKVYVDGKLCGTLPRRTTQGKWYEVTCQQIGREIKLVTTQDAPLSIQGFEAYAVGNDPQEVPKTLVIA